MELVRVPNVRRLGTVVRDARLEAGLSQADLAEATGVSRQWVIGVEQGNPRTEVALVLELLRALGRSIAVLPWEQDDAEEMFGTYLDELDRRDG